MTDSTKEVIARMLKKNTGRSAFDSGSAYGRAWERNQSREFKKEPRGKLRFYSGTRADGNHYGGFSASMNLYHWLTDRLTYAESMDKLFYEIYVPMRDEGETWFSLAQNFKDFLQLTGKWADRKEEIAKQMLSTEEYRQLWGQDEWVWIDAVYASNAEDAELISPSGDVQVWELAFPLGEKIDDWRVEYTYNIDNYLDQDIQYYHFGFDGEYYTILIVHGGCDARSGFTAPHIFETNYAGLSGASECFIHCQNGHIWETTYDGYHFREADTDGMLRPNSKEWALDGDNYEIVDEEEYEERLKKRAEEFNLEYKASINYVSQMKAGQSGFANMEMPTIENFNPELGDVIKHDKDGNGYCPICGTLLELDFFQE